MGVFLSLGTGTKVAAVDFRLFLPEEWAQDTARCAKAKVPEAHRRHLTKTELALEMVKQAKARGSTHRWIGGYEVYGNNHAFTNALEDLGDVFLMDVARTMRVWTEDPAPAVPVATGPKGRGRKAQKPRAQTPGAALTVAALTEARFEAASPPHRDTQLNPKAGFTPGCGPPGFGNGTVCPSAPAPPGCS